MTVPGCLAPMEDYLRRCASLSPPGAGAGRVAGSLRMAADLSGPPGVAHGGGTAALFFELARTCLEAAGRSFAACLPAEITITLQRELAVGTSHDLTGTFERGGGTWEFAVTARRDGLSVAEARVVPVGNSRREGGLALDRPPPADRAFAVPGSESCLVCGSRNARGLSLRLAYDAERVGRALDPLPAFRDAAARVSPAYGFLVLDEVGWWLGALHTGECGVTNRLRIVVWDTAAPGETPIVVGAREGLTPLDRKGRQWEGRVALCGSDGRPLMTGEVAFAGSRVYSNAMVPGLLAASDAADVYRAFPRYALDA